MHKGKFPEAVLGFLPLISETSFCFSSHIPREADSVTFSSPEWTRRYTGQRTLPENVNFVQRVSTKDMVISRIALPSYLQPCCGSPECRGRSRPSSRFPSFSRVRILLLKHRRRRILPPRSQRRSHMRVNKMCYPTQMFGTTWPVAAGCVLFSNSILHALIISRSRWHIGFTPS